MGECLAAALPLIFVIAALVIARIRCVARSRPWAVRRHHFCFTILGNAITATNHEA